MSKALITRLFLGSLLAIVGGLFLMFIAAWFGYVNNAFVMNGPDVVGIRSGTGAWTVAMLAVIGVIAVVGGFFTQFVAWIGAVINTAQLQDKSWFMVLLLLGIFSFGFIAMLFYVLAGPDGRAVTQPQPVTRQPVAIAPTA